jgi:hypothetical protein
LSLVLDQQIELQHLSAKDVVTLQLKEVNKKYLS